MLDGYAVGRAGRGYRKHGECDRQRTRRRGGQRGPEENKEKPLPANAPFLTVRDRLAFKGHFVTGRPCLSRSLASVLKHEGVRCPKKDDMSVGKDPDINAIRRSLISQTIRPNKPTSFL
jgi:hypothetical protein